MDLFSELKRRKVYRVSAGYLALVFAALEGAELVFPTLGVGPGVFNVLVIASVLGFPLTVALAWMFDVTGEGIQRTPPAGEVGSPQPLDRYARLKAALVGAGFVVIVWLGARLWQPLGEPVDPTVPMEQPSLAVLPLQDLSPGSDQAYLADGLHEEILHQIARLRGIRLTSKTSALFLRGVPGEAAGDSLGVRYVLEGSVRMAGDSILVTVQLIDALNDEHLWSEEVGRRFELNELLDLQRVIASRVVAYLQGTLAGEFEVERREPPTRSLAAYNEYLRGVHLTNQFETDAWWRARDHFAGAVQLDPEFGLAHAWLASILAYLNNFAGETQGQFFPQMTEHAKLALQYAPDEPRALLAQMAYLWPQDWNWEEARARIEQAREIDPTNVDAIWYLAEWQGVIAGNPELGLDLLEQGQRLDPFSPRLLIVRTWVRMNAGQMGDAVEDLRALVAMDPTNLDQLKNLISALALSSQTEEALELAASVMERHPRPYPPTLAAHLARAGDEETAREVLNAAVARKAAGGSVAASGIAIAYAALGDVDDALDPSTSRPWRGSRDSRRCGTGWGCTDGTGRWTEPKHRRVGACEVGGL
jgi:TolB-like protein/thioredoxin-like negative regulator of GroEL